MLSPRALFSIDPVYREDAWSRVEGKQIRSFRVRFAAPRNLDAFDNEDSGGAKGARNLATIYDAPEIEIALGVGRRRKQHLNQPSVLSLSSWLKEKKVDVTKMEATIADDGQAEIIDFVDEHMTFGKDLDLPERNPLMNYKRRKLFLDKVFSGKIAYLEEKFGVRPNGHG